MKKILVLLIAAVTLPATAIADDVATGTVLAMSAAGARQLPYEMVISNECSYNYDGLSRVVERVFRRRGVDPLWDNDSIADSGAMYLDIKVHCVSTADSNKTFATQILFSRYNSAPAFYDGDFGSDGYGSDRFFKNRLSESIGAALKVFLNQHAGRS